MSSYKTETIARKFTTIGGRQTMCQDTKTAMRELNTIMTIDVAKKHVASDVGAPYHKAALRGGIDIAIHGDVMYVRWKNKFRTYYATRTIVPTDKQRMCLGGRHTVTIAYHGTQPTLEETAAFL